MEKLKQEGRRVGVYPISQNDWIDMGDWNEYLKLIKNNHEKILIVGGVYDKHAYRFISHLKKEDNSLNIDILSYEQKEEQPDCITYCNDAFHLQESMRKFYKIKYLGLITRAIDFKRTLENLASQHKNMMQY